ncbi:MAG: hypothetical protein ACJAQ6_001878 [Arenicella sp.]|jgi:hypothetical protein
MNTALRILIGLPALLFIFIGLRWAVDPSGAAGMAGMPLLTGIGLSSQIGDFGALFLALGGMALYGSIKQSPSWLYPPAIVLAVIAGYRTIAWLFHGAPFAVTEIIIEIVVATLLILLAKRSSNSPNA